MVEIWKTLKYNSKIYEKYSISNLGNIKSNITNTIYKQHIDKNGYKRFTIYLGYVNNKIKNKNITIHKAVAETFIPNSQNLPMVNHKDGIKINNYAGTPENNFTDGNLEWCTNQYNMQHAKNNGLLNFSAISGQNNKNAKLTNKQVEYIRDVYIPNHKLYGVRALARKFKVTNSVISLIVNNKTYKNII